ncbi:hypothetical protein XOCgx_4742 [Xanthomonas oryzae pv. oryzicola]|nr:hypothetical protein XOCgx_4742 [Xanthomonas oryzae pv. oryzicola]
MLQGELASCSVTGGCDEVVQKYVALSKSNDLALQQTCSQDPSGSACQQGVREALSYVGDQSWKNYAFLTGSPTTVPTGNTYSLPLTQMDDDIKDSRKSTLDMVFGDRQVYAAINDIIPRADFFGAMARQTGAAWFGAAESQSRVNLSGPDFDFLAGWNKYWGAGDVMDNWRSAAGNEIMSHGYGNFSDIYFYGNKIDLKEWSVKQLVSEQNDPSLQVIHEYYIKNMTQATIYLMQKAGHVDNVLNPSDRVNTGCVNMGYGKGCGDAYLNGNSGN